MIDCEHYENYKGPHLKLAKIWKTKDKKLDITEYIKNFMVIKIIEWKIIYL